MCNTIINIFTACQLAFGGSAVEFTPAVTEQAHQSLQYALHAFVYASHNPEFPFDKMGCNFPPASQPAGGRINGVVTCEALDADYTVTITQAKNATAAGQCSEPLMLEGRGPLTVTQTCNNVTYTMELTLQQD